MRVMTKSLNLSLISIIFSAAYAFVSPTLAFAGDVASSSEIQKTSRCEQFLLSSKKIASLPFKWAKTSWLEFRAEAREHGAIRYVLAPRMPPEKFNFFAAFLDPLIDLPVEVYSFIKHKIVKRAPVKKRLSAWTSLPIGILAWTLIFQGVDNHVYEKSVTSLEQAVAAGRFGAEYISEWVLTGALTPVEAVRILKNSEETFRNDLAPVRARIGQFVNQGVWTKSQAEKANQILTAIAGNTKPNEVMEHKGLEKYLMSSPAFLELATAIPQESQYTLTLLTAPSVEQFGQLDSYWLSLFFDKNRRGLLSPNQLRGLESIDNLYKHHSENLSLTAVAYLVGKTIGDEKGMAQKLKKAGKYSIRPEHGFQYRSDMPVFTTSSIFTDLTEDVDLDDELDLWKLIFSDPRFSSFRKAFEAKSASDFTVLIETLIHANALSQIHLLHRKYEGASLPAEEMCGLVHGTPSSNGNPIFNGLKEPLVDGTKLSQLKWLKIELAYLYFQTFVSANSIKNEVALTKHFQDAFVQEQNLVKAALEDSGANLAEKYKTIAKPSCW